VELTVEPLKPIETRMPGAELVIIEMFGGDNNLSAFVHQDLEEIAAGIAGSNIAVVGLCDLANKPGVIVEVTPENGIQILEQLGEIDTGDPRVLHNFLVRALITYPNARKAIGFWDHGSGVFDETDASEVVMARVARSVTRENRSRSFPARRLFFSKDRLLDDFETRAMLHDDTNGGVLTNLEAGAMLGAAFKDAGIKGQIDLIFSDTCLNGMIEVLDELGPYAKCIVGSSDLEPGDGWDYKAWLSKVKQEKPTTAEDWGRTAVEAFQQGYEPYPKKYPCTLGAFRTDHQITKAFAAMIQMVSQDANPREAFAYLDYARSQAQGFARRDTYDVRNFATILKAASEQGGKPQLVGAADEIIRAYDAARVTSCCLGDIVKDSSGLSFYFPGSKQQMRRDMKTYERLSFAKATGWADYLKAMR
jgi:hypothetical protein